MERLAARRGMTTSLNISAELVSETIAQLQLVGRTGSEHVLLWLGRRKGENVLVERLWVPEQQAGSDFFEIPERSMEQLFEELRKFRFLVAAQVHTHPREAFHSYADDRWAIVRHVGALSLVVPYFALQTNFESFVKDTAVFVLSGGNKWMEVPLQKREDFYKISL
jgi:hypothetical protein